MVFRMSYDITPPSVTVATSPAIAVPKTRPLSGGRKGNSPHVQAEALFDPALARSGDTKASLPQADMSDDVA